MPITKPRPRKVKKRSKAKLPEGMDSWFEVDLAEKQLRACSWKPDKIPYVTEHVYNPDASFLTPTGKEYIIEAKGRFRDRKEASKYVSIRKALKPNQELVFIFMHKGTYMPGARKRADGTKQTMEEWAEKNKFTYYYPSTVPRSWSVRR